MHNAPFDDIYAGARRAAQVHAALAVLANALPSADRADLEQESLLAFWRALPLFDPTRASLRTFAERVIANQIASIVRAQRAVRRKPVPMSWPKACEHPGPSIELRIDIRRVVDQLQAGDQRLARLLSDYPPTDASRILHKSRSSIYEGIRRIRLAFEEAGLAPGSSRRSQKILVAKRTRTKNARCGPEEDTLTHLYDNGLGDSDDARRRFQVQAIAAVDRYLEGPR